MLTLLLSLSCGVQAPPEEATTLPHMTGSGERSVGGLGEITHWLYLIDSPLDSTLVGRVAGSEHDLVVLDFKSSVQDTEDFAMGAVLEELHEAESPKTVLAYVDIGQAEDYRTYWQPGWAVGDPDWIAAEDPEGWEGNYPVAYWRDEWREIWLADDGYVAQVAEAGFDGLYLDWIEAYDDPAVKKIAAKEGRDPEAEMIAWVGDLARLGRSLSPGFLVVAQNALELLEYPEYLQLLDGVAQEAVWFDEDAADGFRPDIPTDSELTKEYLGYLEMAKEKGLTVLTADYATDPGNVRAVLQEARIRGFVPFVGQRSLGEYQPPGMVTGLRACALLEYRNLFGHSPAHASTTLGAQPIE